MCFRFVTPPTRTLRRRSFLRSVLKARATREDEISRMNRTKCVLYDIVLQKYSKLCNADGLVEASTDITTTSGFSQFAAIRRHTSSSNALSSGLRHGLNNDLQFSLSSAVAAAPYSAAIVHATTANRFSRALFIAVVLPLPRTP
jgi:hypothetical protein